MKGLYAEKNSAANASNQQSIVEGVLPSCSSEQKNGLTNISLIKFVKDSKIVLHLKSTTVFKALSYLLCSIYALFMALLSPLQFILAALVSFGLSCGSYLRFYYYAVKVDQGSQSAQPKDTLAASDTCHHVSSDASQRNKKDVKDIYSYLDSIQRCNNDSLLSHSTNGADSVGTSTSISTSTNRSDNCNSNKVAVFVHFRKCAGTSIVSSLSKANKVKFPFMHKNGNAWVLESSNVSCNCLQTSLAHTYTEECKKSFMHSQIIRFWELKNDEFNNWITSLINNNVTAFACEWGVPKCFEDNTYMDTTKMEVFTCMRDPFARFRSEFEFHDRFFVDMSETMTELEDMIYCESKSNVGNERYNSSNSSNINEHQNYIHLVPEKRKGIKASEWINQKLYWNRDNQIPFPVSVNKPNFFVRMLCGLASSPDVVIEEKHLERAKQVLSKFSAVIILEDAETHCLLDKWGCDGPILPKVLGKGSLESSKEKKELSLLDIEVEEFRRLNRFDYELYKYAHEISRRHLNERRRAMMTIRNGSTFFEKLRFKHTNGIHDHIMSNTDMVIPLKRRGAIFRSVVGAVNTYYQPRKIIVICGKTDLEWLKTQIPKWKSLGEVGNIELVDEETLFLQRYGQTKITLKRYFDEQARKLRMKPVEEKSTLLAIGEREFGWWYQQLIKLGSGIVLGLSPTYIVWDADLIPLKRWDLCTSSNDGKSHRYFTAVLQTEAKTPALTNEYDKCMRILAGISSRLPEGGGTFVTHHMAFNQDICNHLLNVMEQRRQMVWPLAILSMASECTRFSEYLTYSSFALTHYPDKFEYHPVSQFGTGGVRIRGGLHIVDALVTSKNLAGNHDVYGGFSYESFCDFASSYFDKEKLPPYVQLDHVYVAPKLPINAPLYPPPAISFVKNPLLSQSTNSTQPFELGKSDNTAAGISDDSSLVKVKGSLVSRRSSLRANKTTTTTRKLWSYKDFYINSPTLISDQGSGMSCDESASHANMENLIKERTEKLDQRKEFWWDLFRKYNIIFVHIPKNAGTSVEALFLGPNVGSPCSQHFTARELRKQNPEEFTKLMKFCVVRNPYDRFLSAYTYLKNGGNRKSGSNDLVWEQEIAKYPTFYDFICALFPENDGSRVPDWRQSFLPSHFIPQHIFTCGNQRDGYRLLVDKIIYMSDLVRNAENAFMECGIPLNLHHPNKNTKKTSATSNSDKLDEGNSSIYENVFPHLRRSADRRDVGYDVNSAKIIFDVYKRDFELFGFRKESWKRWVQS